MPFWRRQEPLVFCAGNRGCEKLAREATARSLGGGGWGDGKQKQQTSTWGKVKGRCQLNLSKSFMSFVDLTKFQNYKMLPENPDKIQSDTSSMKRNFRKEIHCSKGSVFRHHLFNSHWLRCARGWVPEPLGFGWMENPPQKRSNRTEKTHGKSSKVQIERHFGRWIYCSSGKFLIYVTFGKKKSGELGPIVEVSLSCEDFRFQTQHPQHQVKIWWESTGFHSKSLNSEFWD